MQTPTKQTPLPVTLRCLRDGRTQTHLDDGYEVSRVQGRTQTRPCTGRARLLRALTELSDPRTGAPVWALAERPAHAPAIAGDPVLAARTYDDPAYDELRARYAAARTSQGAAAAELVRAEVARREADANAQARALASALAPALAAATAAATGDAAPTRPRRRRAAEGDADA